MLPFGVTIPATVPQSSEIPEGPMNYHVYIHTHNYSSGTRNVTSHQPAQSTDHPWYKPMDIRARTDTGTGAQAHEI
jgi:hypothetical protein